MATGENTATFVPVVTDYGVDIFVDEVDGQPTKFGELDSATVDAGEHELAVRLEYQPASGSAIVIGGLANLLIRAGTNKTFRTTISLAAEAGHLYQISARTNADDELEIAITDQTLNQEIAKQTFRVSEGGFERIS
ncbi:hypothetical protein N9985_01085 [Gammaproteobacteria bacterium]|nr:hypothetical protein [Gammaproteobacteria bacterium]